MAELGAFGMTIPEAYGGYGFSASAYCRVTEEIGRTDASLGILIGGHQSIGLKGLILYGNEAQKKKWLPKLAAGEMIAAFALTEPEAGSDAASIRTTAVYDETSDATGTIDGTAVAFPRAWGEFTSLGLQIVLRSDPRQPIREAIGHFHKLAMKSSIGIAISVS